MSDSLYQRILAHYTIYEGEVWHLHIFESDGKTPVIRPGASLYATGVYGFLGNWHTLLCTNARNTTLFADPKKEFQPYAGSENEWNVSFEITGMHPYAFRQKGGSWTHSERTSLFRNLKNGKEASADVWWSGLAPGVLFDFHAPSITVSDNTLLYPSAPARLVAEVDGKVVLISDPARLNPAKMSAKYLRAHSFIKYGKSTGRLASTGGKLEVDQRKLPVG